MGAFCVIVTIDERPPKFSFFKPDFDTSS
jgi:hypothetical protein